MDFVKVEEVKDEFIVLRPVYADGANATEIWLETGEVLVDRRGLRGVVKAVSRYFMIDVSAQKEKIAEMLQCGGIIPFYINEKRIFVPLKMRKALSSNDMVHGYVNLAWLGKIESAGGKRCRAILNNDMEIELFSSRMTAIGSQNNGQRVREMLEQAEANSEEKQVLNSVRYLIGFFNNMTRQLDRIEDRIAEGKEVSRGRFS